MNQHDDGTLEYETRTVDAALEAFSKVLAATPAIDPDKIQEQYEFIRTVWKGDIFVGTPSEVTDLLGQNLRRDAAIAPVRFLVEVIPDQSCAQVYTLIGNRAIAYRVWRSTTGVLALSGGPNMII
jgi:hypothetical protein